MMDTRYWVSYYRKQFKDKLKDGQPDEAFMLKYMDNIGYDRLDDLVAGVAQMVEEGDIIYDVVEAEYHSIKSHVMKAVE